MSYVAWNFGSNWYLRPFHDILQEILTYLIVVSWSKKSQEERFSKKHPWFWAKWSWENHWCMVLVVVCCSIYWYNLIVIWCPETMPENAIHSQRYLVESSSSIIKNLTWAFLKMVDPNHPPMVFFWWCLKCGKYWGLLIWALAMLLYVIVCYCMFLYVLVCYGMVLLKAHYASIWKVVVFLGESLVSSKRQPSGVQRSRSNVYICEALVATDFKSNPI